MLETLEKEVVQEKSEIIPATAKVAVVGLGYVGLPLALEFAKAGFEVIGIDNKLSPTESLNALKAALDQGVRYITQGNGSSVALALVDAVNKHNERNPGKEVLYLNHSAVDPDLTNSKCSFWHFRFDAHADMRMAALMSVLREDREAVVLADRLGYREAFIGEHITDLAETITSCLIFIARPHAMKF